MKSEIGRLRALAGLGPRDPIPTAAPPPAALVRAKSRPAAMVRRPPADPVRDACARAAELADRLLHATARPIRPEDLAAMEKHAARLAGREGDRARAILDHLRARFVEQLAADRGPLAIADVVAAERQLGAITQGNVTEHKRGWLGLLRVRQRFQGQQARAADRRRADLSAQLAALPPGSERSEFYRLHKTDLT